MHNCFQLYVWTPMKRVLGSELCSGDETLPATKLINIFTMVEFAVARGLSSLQSQQCSAFYLSITLDSYLTFSHVMNVSQKNVKLGALRSLQGPGLAPNTICPPVVSVASEAT